MIRLRIYDRIGESVKKEYVTRLLASHAVRLDPEPILKELYPNCDYRVKIKEHYSKWQAGTVYGAKDFEPYTHLYEFFFTDSGNLNVKNVLCLLTCSANPAEHKETFLSTLNTLIEKMTTGINLNKDEIQLLKKVFQYDKLDKEGAGRDTAY